MASSITDDYVLVAAIDFGTTFSGYAFSMKTEPKTIFMNKSWGEALEVKTPTSILLDWQGKVKAFGTQAESDFMSEGAKTKHDFHLFQHFKMELHQLETLSKEIQVTSKDGEMVTTAFDLVSKALEFIKRKLLGEISNFGQTIHPHEIRWVVTVPAIWSDVSKRFMREAAYKAGLIEDVNSTQLLIALEPEAGAFFCRSVDANNMAVVTNDPNEALLPGSKYVVVDAGGGTVDIAVHEVTGPSTAKEVFYATGGGWGGNRVNESFEHFMAKILGADMISTYKRDCPFAWWEFIQKFELKKRSWSEGRALTIPLSQMLSHMYDTTQEEKGKKETISDAFARKKNMGVDFSQGIIKCKSDSMRDIFNEAVQLTIDHLHALMLDDRMEDVDTMMLVGGFSESPYLQEAIKREFGARALILVPQQASLAVVKGAVLFGHNPTAVEERCLARTYGTGTNSVFDPEIHNASKKFESEGKVYCGDLFSTFVKKDTYVKAGDFEMFRYFPLKSTQTSVRFVLYSADKHNVKYIDEGGVYPVNEMTLPMPDTSKGKDRPIDVKVTFGHTEIMVNATDVNTKEEVIMKDNLFFYK